MLVTVTGGSGSGKSEYSENLLLSLDGKHHGGRAYIATMYPYDKESFKRIDRHREMRKNKGFTTVECYTGLKQLMLPEGCRSALLECMSNLAANECFMENGAGADTVPEILAGVRHLYKQHFYRSGSSLPGSSHKYSYIRSSYQLTAVLVS